MEFLIGAIVGIAFYIHLTEQFKEDRIKRTLYEQYKKNKCGTVATKSQPDTSEGGGIEENPLGTSQSEL